MVILVSILVRIFISKDIETGLYHDLKIRYHCLIIEALLVAHCTMYARKPHYAVSFFRYADTKGRPCDTVMVKPILYLYV